jgi:hypothetical protein
VTVVAHFRAAPWTRRSAQIPFLYTEAAHPAVMRTYFHVTGGRLELNPSADPE